MERKLYISNEAIKKYGKEYFENYDTDNYELVSNAFWGDFYKLDDGLLLIKDDMDDLYLSVNKDDEVFENIEDL